MDKYAKIVKEMHRPEISPKKQRELEKIKEEIDKRNKPVKVVYENKHSKILERGNEYMSSRYSQHRSANEPKYQVSDAEDAISEVQLKNKKSNVDWK